MSEYDKLTVGFGEGFGRKVTNIYNLKPTNGTGDFTFERASLGSDYDGTVQQIDMPTVKLLGSCPCLQLEKTATNLYLNTTVLETQDVTTTAIVYVVSFYGIGTLNFTGSYVGSLVGTGENDRVSLEFTASAGTLTSTVLDDINVNKAQLEVDLLTSYMPSTGSPGVRAKDIVLPVVGSQFYNSLAGGIAINFSANGTDGVSDRQRLTLSDGLASNSYIEFVLNDQEIWIAYWKDGVRYHRFLYPRANMIDPNALNKVVISYNANVFEASLNGSIIGSEPMLNPYSENTLTSFQLADEDNTLYCVGVVQQAKAYNLQLEEEETGRWSGFETYQSMSDNFNFIVQ
jgi:hypothetical protein